MKMSDIEIFDHLAELVDFFVVPLQQSSRLGGLSIEVCFGV